MRHHRRYLHLCMFGLTIIAFLFGFTSLLLAQLTPPPAPTIVVGNGSAASCTEAALDAALDVGGTITFNCGGAVTITFTTTKRLTANDPDATIDGGGKVTFSGGDALQLFRVSSSRALKLRNLVLRDGKPPSGGGGALQNAGITDLYNVVFQNNTADFGSGGAISNSGVLHISRATFKENYANTAGGALYNDANGRINIAGSAFVQNTSAGTGGAIYVNGNVSADSTVNIANSTFADNYAKSGGAIYAYGSSATVNITHATFAGNTGAESASTLGKDAPAFILVRSSIFTAPGMSAHCSFGINDQGGNVVHGLPCEGIVNPASIGDPLLGDLEGAPPYFPLENGSAAVNVVNNCTYLNMGENPLFTDGAPVQIDQRWYARPAEALCDAGAYEANAAPAELTITPTPSMTYTPSETPTETETPVESYTPTETPTDTATWTLTFTPTHTPTFTPSYTPSLTYTPITYTPTSSLTPTATDTPGAPTATPTATADATATPGGSSSLIINGGFEDDTNGDGQPDGWTVSAVGGGKRKCNKGEKLIAFVGNCAYQFKGDGMGAAARLSQTWNTDTLPPALDAGDTLTLAGYYSAKGAVDAKVRLRVKYQDTDGDPSNDKQKLTLNITAPTQGYVALTGDLSLVLTGTPINIRLQLQSSGVGSRVRFDAIDLLLTEGGAARLPLP